MSRADLEKLSKEELVELVLKLQRPPKTSRTSSKPPSTDRKAKRGNSKPGGAKPGHKGNARRLCETPDKIVDHRPDRCPGCGAAFAPDAVGDVIGECDRIDLPPITPFIERHRRLRCTCAGCGAMTKAPAPEAASGSPFGPGLVALVVYLKHCQMASYQRLQGLLADVTGLTVSQGALTSMLARAEQAFRPDYERILARLRRAEAVASDETGMRIEGVNGQHWVFRSRDAIVHHVDFSRGAQVVRDVMGGHKPEFWLSDRYSAQQGHGEKHQTCLAHLARDINRVLEVGDEKIGLRLKCWMMDVFRFAGGIASSARSTIARKCRDLEERVDDILRQETACDVTAAVMRKIGNARDQLLTFVRRPDLVDTTNNGSERDLRMSVITRKVTNGFRALWAAQADATIRTVVDTRRMSGASPYQTIRKTLTP